MSLEADIPARLSSVRSRLERAAASAGRDPREIRLIAVSKTFGIEAVRAAASAGQVDFGENRVQEALDKIDLAKGLSLRWHLIGHLQSNKARRTLPMVRWIHAVDSLKLLRALDALVGDLGLTVPPPVCLQVNTSGEETKHGWTPAGVIEDAEAIAACRAIPVVGLMTMAAWGTDAETARPSFVQLRQTRDALRVRTGLALPDLSMGMSGDFESAVEEGATLVRVGSALLEGVEE